MMAACIKAAIMAQPGPIWKMDLSATQFYHFEVENDEGDTWGGTQDNGILERDGTGEGSLCMLLETAMM